MHINSWICMNGLLPWIIIWMWIPWKITVAKHERCFFFWRWFGAIYCQYLIFFSSLSLSFLSPRLFNCVNWKTSSSSSSRFEFIFLKLYSNSEATKTKKKKNTSISTFLALENSVIWTFLILTNFFNHFVAFCLVTLY